MRSRLNFAEKNPEVKPNIMILMTDEIYHDNDLKIPVTGNVKRIRNNLSCYKSKGDGKKQKYQGPNCLYCFIE